MKCHLESAENLTVGKLFELACQSDSAAGPEFSDLSPEKLELRLDQENQYKLKIIKTEKFSPTEIKLTLTSYKVGEHHLKAVQMVEGEKSYVLGDLDFTVASVMDPQNPQKEPYPSQGPLGISIPLWYWAVALALISAIGFQIYWKIRQKKEKKKLLQEMQVDGFAATPLAQFFQAIRKIQRNHSFFSSSAVELEESKKFVQDLDQAYRLYLARIFMVPTFFWSERKILSDIKSNHRVLYQELLPTLRKGLAELSRAKKATSMTAQDCLQLNDLIRKQVDQIENVRGRK